MTSAPGPVPTSSCGVGKFSVPSAFRSKNVLHSVGIVDRPAEVPNMWVVVDSDDQRLPHVDLQGVDEVADVFIAPRVRGHPRNIGAVVSISPDPPDRLGLIFGALDLPFLSRGRQ